MKIIKKIKVDITLYLFIFLMLYSGYKALFFIQLLVFFIHEVGHLIFIYIFNINLIEVKLYPFGGVIKTNKILNYPIYKDFFIAFGGILFNVIFVILNNLTFNNHIFNKYSYMLIFINLIPVIPLDGNKILFILLSKFISYYKAYILSILTSIVTIIYIISLGFVNHNLNYIFCFILVVFLLREIGNFSYVYNKFLFERYIYNLNFKYTKKYHNYNLKLLKRNTLGLFGKNELINERNLLAKKFDNSSYFW